MKAEPAAQEGLTAVSAVSSFLLVKIIVMEGQQCQQARNALRNGDIWLQETLKITLRCWSRTEA